MSAALLFLALTKPGATPVKPAELPRGRKPQTLVAGEAEVPDHEGEIEISSWGWSMNKRDEAQATVSGRREVSHGRPSAFTFKKPPDSSTTVMLQALDEGQLFPQAVFHLYERLTGSKELTEGDFDLQIVLTDVELLSYELDASSGDKSVELEESWKADYTSIEFRYLSTREQLLIKKSAADGAADPGNPTSDIMERVMKAKLSPKGLEELIKKLGTLQTQAAAEPVSLGKVGKKSGEPG